MSGRRVILTRHGESEFLRNSRFCGWVDSQLTEEGKLQAIEAGRLLCTSQIQIDECHTSVLSRAENTLRIMLEHLGERKFTPVYKHWRLNERHYGALTGLKKLDVQNEFGKEKVALWRRGYDVPLPPMLPNHPYYKIIRSDPRYRNGPPECQFPDGESLKDTMTRVLPYYRDTILPTVRKGNTVLVVTHGTVVRGIVKYLEEISDEDISKVDIPTAIPTMYEFNAEMELITIRKYLADDETVQRVIDNVSGVEYKTQ